ncbi:MAG: TrbI/VirB10 family protein [Pseudomonadota bacterium]|nr:TrbI/VirB10 family protein [Pseudomonadota bacterium]
MAKTTERTQGFPRNLLPILAGFLFMLVGGGLLYTASHKDEAAEEKSVQAAVRPGRAESVEARAREQAGPDSTAAEGSTNLPASPGTAPSGPLPAPVAGADYRLPPGDPAAGVSTSGVDVYAERKEEARSATASLAAYEEFDSAKTVALPQTDTLAAVEKALSGMVQPVVTGGDATAALVQRALQTTQAGGAGSAKAQSARSSEQRTVADAEPPLTATAAPSPWMLFQGTAIPAVLVTPVTSDAPGSLTARVTRDVYDDVRAQRLLIPKGSRLYGAYMNEVGEGQERILMAFSRLIFPDGQSVRLAGASGGDAMGRSGVPAEVNNHFWKMFGAGFLIAGIAKIFDRSSQADVTVINQAGGSTTLTDSAGQILTETARRVLEKKQNISPTLNLPEGYKFNVIVNRDMALAPVRVTQPAPRGWKEGKAETGKTGYASTVLSRGTTSAAMTRPTIHLMTRSSRSILTMSVLVARFSADKASAALRATSSGMPAERKASYTSEIIMAMSEPQAFSGVGEFYA